MRAPHGDAGMFDEIWREITRTRFCRVSGEGRAFVECPFCNARWTQDASTEKIGIPLDMECPRCAEDFRVVLDRRMYPRIPTWFVGELRSQRSGEAVEVFVTDLSRGGVGLELVRTAKIQPGAEFVLVFRADDSRNASIVADSVRVRYVQGSRLGCEFLSPGGIWMQKLLGENGREDA